MKEIKLTVESRALGEKEINSLLIRTALSDFRGMNYILGREDANGYNLVGYNEFQSVLPAGKNFIWASGKTASYCVGFAGWTKEYKIDGESYALTIALGLKTGSPRMVSRFFHESSLLNRTGVVPLGASVFKKINGYWNVTQYSFLSNPNNFESVLTDDEVSMLRGVRITRGGGWINDEIALKPYGDGKKPFHMLTSLTDEPIWSLVKTRKQVVNLYADQKAYYVQSYVNMKGDKYFAPELTVMSMEQANKAFRQISKTSKGVSKTSLTYIVEQAANILDNITLPQFTSVAREVEIDGKNYVVISSRRKLTYSRNERGEEEVSRIFVGKNKVFLAERTTTSSLAGMSARDGWIIVKNAVMNWDGLFSRYAMPNLDGIMGKGTRLEYVRKNIMSISDRIKAIDPENRLSLNFLYESLVNTYGEIVLKDDNIINLAVYMISRGKYGFRSDDGVVCFERLTSEIVTDFIKDDMRPLANKRNSFGKKKDFFIVNDKVLSKLLNANKAQLAKMSDNEMTNCRLDSRLTIEDFLNAIAKRAQISKYRLDNLNHLSESDLNELLEMYGKINIFNVGNRRWGLQRVIGNIDKVSEFREFMRVLAIASVDAWAPAMLFDTWDIITDIRLFHRSEDMRIPYFRTSVKTDADIHAWHDEVMNLQLLINAERNRVREEAERKRFEELQENFDKRHKALSRYAFQDENFTMVVPKTAKDLQLEGMHLGHCVKSYIDRHAQGVTNILFIRCNDSLDKPFFTVELDNHCIIQQVHGRGNSNVSASSRSQELQKFIENFAKEKNVELGNYNKVR